MKAPDRLGAELESGAADLGVRLGASVVKDMLVFIGLMKRWNAVYNLTAVADVEHMLTRHILDSLSVVPHLHGSRIADIGSGAGLPGIPLALACPQRQLTLIDSNAKRCRFLRQVKADLSLNNIKIVQQRVEEFQPDEKFDSLLSRAFSDLPDFIVSSRHLLEAGGKIIAMKGLWKAVMAENLPPGIIIEKIVKLDVPGLNEQRHLVICAESN